MTNRMAFAESAFRRDAGCLGVGGTFRVRTATIVNQRDARLSPVRTAAHCPLADPEDNFAINRRVFDR